MLRFGGENGTPRGKIKMVAKEISGESAIADKPSKNFVMVVHYASATITW